MKKSFTLFLSFVAYFGFITGVNATDLAVAENGTGGAYATITEAINAAADGDRIIVSPKSGGAPYSENLTIDKSLQFLCNNEGEMFVMQGSITITPASGRTVTFIGMKNLLGNIDGSSNNAGSRCVVNIMNCEFTSGNLNFSYDYYDLNLVSTVINGKVAMKYGKVIGNQISAVDGYCVTIASDANITNDTIMIIANKLISNYPNYTHGGIYWGSSSHYFSMMNNYVKIANAYSSWATYSYGINVVTAKNSNTGVNVIENNTLSRHIGSGGTNYSGGIQVSSTPVNSTVTLMNNLIIANSTETLQWGLVFASNSGIVSASYTYMNSYVSSPFNGLTDNGTNSIASNATIDIDGNLALASDAINAGNADSIYYDIDLTRNDIGCYGGSYTLDNYFPITGAARVYLLMAPRRITVGNTMNIKAEAFDR
ncbi:MAG TPA: hypothetical protein DDX39_03535 [Bacteroidales bacterium]|nr:MAG: hypothetical protein A2W98_12785 [Bacteroidetes bacterium GWF2_33_38]OFY75230.1 MAG: hypothetical protein A2265_11325 [Bacteroidetes bacterium RIFOXYA12_FULL_33_9]OFY91910.1 MAG: hypothetical protein A2236_13485 [Bacteroidetes bacterium RIFOXYA2_FULL_33_7]HBF87692.1 hypothetical protein [Bacteroidales bacterium]